MASAMSLGSWSSSHVPCVMEMSSPRDCERSIVFLRETNSSSRPRDMYMVDHRAGVSFPTPLHARQTEATR